MSLRRLIGALPPDFYLTLIDVGSAGGLHKRWHDFRSILSAILFEPREGGTAQGGIGRGQSRTYPVALSDRAGAADLYLTALPNMSSFLRPDAEVFGRFRKKKADASVVGTESVPVERLDAIAAADGFRPDVLKVDTQGSELLVLKGAERCLQSVVVAEVEVSFFRRYVGQPVFAEIEAWMNERRFELIELHRLKRYRAANSLGLRRPIAGDQRSGRVAYGDAIFMRRQQDIVAAARQDEGQSVLKGVVALLAYGKSDHAAALLDAGQECLPADRAASMGKALAGMKRIRVWPLLTALLQRG